MSAGSGLTHSEYNNSDEVDVNFLQIWVFPKQKNISPRYGQLFFDTADRKNIFQILVSPKDSDETIWINQDAWFSMADIDSGKQISYEKQIKDNGVYFFVLEGEAEIDGHSVEQRDGLGLSHGESHLIRAGTDVHLLAIEVPMS